MTREQRRMEKIVKEFQEYVASYTNQKYYRDYSPECFLDDVVYGVGIALNNSEYKMAGGFDRFKDKVMDWWNNNNRIPAIRKD